MDGLRGIAILLVISFHYLPSVAIFNFGWSGVDLFFLLAKEISS
jgi:peptidoglycan/LPS O-acetylase OafA/YrhL